MSVLAVDLAAKYSAAVHLGGATVHAQFDSTVGETAFLERVTAEYMYGFADQLVVEDLPHGVSYRSLVKRVCQLQGRLVERMYAAGRLSELIFVAPATWRAVYAPLRKRGAGPEAVIPIAVERGYVPPVLDHLRGPRGGVALHTKINSDYCAAYLIAVWANDIYTRHGTYDVPGTERYGHKTRITPQKADDD